MERCAVTEPDLVVLICALCKDDLDQECTHFVECFEEVGELLCEGCWEQWLEDNSQFGVGA